MSAPLDFEPHPPGVPRPILLSPAYNNSLSLFRAGAGGPWRLLLQESFGYSVLDLTNPASPTAIRWGDMRFDAPNQIPQHGDGQSYIQTVAVSPDGQRSAFSVNGPAEPNWHTLVGRPDGGNGYGMWGDFGGSRNSGTVVHQVGARYIVYSILGTSSGFAADVTSLPSSLGSLNLAYEATSWPAGTGLGLAGGFLYYIAGNAIQVIDASNPGPAGNITASYKKLQFTNAAVPDFGGRTPQFVSGAVDPANSSKLWLLVALGPLAGEDAPSYGLVSVTRDGGGNLSAPVSSGPVFRVPSAPGEKWVNVGTASSLVSKNGSLFVLMWSNRRQPSYQFVLFSTTVGTWPLAAGQVVQNPNFSVGSQMAFLDGGGYQLYGYAASGDAWMIPMTCQVPNAPATSLLDVTNASAGTVLAEGGTAYLGDTLTVVPTVLPIPAIKPLSDWRFDFDFHDGNAVEDAGTQPRIRNLDNGQFGNPPTPPAQVTLVGPCDPQAGGVPASGAGCWSSVRTNSAAGGPDFTGAETPASPPRPLKIALEATNVHGSANTAVFTVNWLVPAARVAATQLFSGQPLVSASDGHPTGYKWYFGATPSTLAQKTTCGGPTCVPTLDTKGTYYYWLTATYAGGFATPDYAGTSAMGTYTITDFAPAFLVNGSATGPVAAYVSSSLAIQNSSQHGSGIAGAYFYSLCAIPDGQSTCASAYTSLVGMTDPPTSGTPSTSAAITTPGTPGNYLFRVRVDFTGGTTYWPDPAGVAGIAVTLAAPRPSLHIWVKGQDPCPPGPFCIENSVRAKAGDALIAYSYVNGVEDFSGTLSWNFPGATPSTANGNGIAYSYDTAGTYDIVLTRNGTAYTYPGAAVIAPRPLPPTATASALPNPATFVDNVRLTCTAAGGSGNYTISWAISDGATGSFSPIFHTFGAAGSYTATCTATDTSTGLSGASAPVTVVVGLPPGSGGPYPLSTLSPCRVLDTRNAAGPLGGPAIQPAGAPDRSFNVAASSCGIPADAKSISVNVTATNVTASGAVSIYRGDGARTGTNTGILLVGRTRANNAILQLALDGSGTVKVQNTSAGSFDLIVDVNGYFR
ncbi:MAG TPA: PKD domain-containing protein [Thermoanaerobaculia bacterium]|jgi:hypothetical protein